MNSINLVGRLARDVQNTVSKNGKNVARFTVACKRKFKSDSGEYDADFIPCVAFGKTAEFISKYFSKGNSIGIIGTVQSSSYESSDGKKKYSLDVLVENVEFISGNAKSDGNKQSEEDKQIEADDLFGEELKDFDMPF